MIEIKNVTKVFNKGCANEVVAVKEVNLAIKEGELVILKGPSGSGKSTILSLIAALSKPSSGEIITDGKRISKLPDNFASIFRREKIGFIFQKFNLIGSLSVYENIILPLIPTTLSKAQIEKKAYEVMKKFSIEHKKQMRADSLSGGEQQRVAISRALINDPKIILADEPTANLDAKLSQDFLRFIKKMKDENKTIIIATHDPIFFDLDFGATEIEVKNGRLV
jgi:putative ABC transport system ATP-binding protein